MFFTVFVLCILRLFKLKTDGQAEIQKSSMQNYKTQIKISLILGFQQQSPGAPLFGLAKSM